MSRKRSVVPPGAVPTPTQGRFSLIPTMRQEAAGGINTRPSPGASLCHALTSLDAFRSPRLGGAPGSPSPAQSVAAGSGRPQVDFHKVKENRRWKNRPTPDLSPWMTGSRGGPLQLGARPENLHATPAIPAPTPLTVPPPHLTIHLAIDRRQLVSLCPPPDATARLAHY